MNKKNTKYLLEHFPNLYKQYHLPMQQTCMCWGFDVEDGWFKLIKELSKKIVSINPECEASQVKEKFGGLRFYCDNGDKETWDLINESENKSYTICEVCGKEGELRTSLAWIKTLCNNHYKKERKRIEDVKRRYLNEGRKKN